jgi:hypothetical protein
MTYMIHMLSAIVFLPVLLLPFLAKRWEQLSAEELGQAAKRWRILLIVVHAGLVISLITGIVLSFDYTSSWFWLSIIVFLALGAFLGITLKQVRLIGQAAQQGGEISPVLAKLIRFSWLLAITYVLIMVLMSSRW